jgi:hypothetical protein
MDELESLWCHCEANPSEMERLDKQGVAHAVLAECCAMPNAAGALQPLE